MKDKTRDTIKILEDNKLTNIYSPEDQIKMKLNDLSNPDDKFNAGINLSKTMKENHIRTYDNTVPPEYCKEIIEKFEKSKEQYEKVDSGHKMYTEINVDLWPDWYDIRKRFKSLFKLYTDKFIKDVGIQEHHFPAQVNMEQVRIKKYEPNNKDEFKNHVDVGSYASARRFLVFFLYLNDTEGGETVFTNYDLRVKPRAGRILMFPPFWTHPHTGKKPINKPKYIIGSYLHYGDTLINEPRRF